MTDAALRAEVLALVAASDLSAVAGRRGDGAWGDLLRVAGARLHPWLAHRLASHGRMEALPVATRSTLESAARAAALWELRRRNAFGTLASALDAASIPFIALKGMALAYSVYPVPSLRPMADMDLWIGPEHRSEALGILTGLGWHTPPRYRTHPQPADAEVKLELAGSRLLLEVHERPFSLRWAPSGGDGPWERATDSLVAGRAARVLEPLDQLTHSATHLGVRSGYVDGLLGLLDITLLARALGGAGAWDQLAERHLTAGIAPSCALALSLARDLLGAPVPESYFRVTSAAQSTARLRAVAIEQLWDHDAGAVTGVDGAVAAGRSGMLAAIGVIARYVRQYHGGPPREGQGRLAALAARLRYDVVDRVPRYARAWQRGEFGRERLARRASMFNERYALIAALEAADRDGARPLTPAPAAPNAPR